MYAGIWSLSLRKECVQYDGFTFMSVRNWFIALKLGNLSSLVWWKVPMVGGLELNDL